MCDIMGDFCPLIKDECKKGECMFYRGHRYHQRSREWDFECLLVQYMKKVAGEEVI